MAKSKAISGDNPKETGNINADPQLMAPPAEPLDNITSTALDLPVDQVCPDFRKGAANLTESEVVRILQVISTSFNVPTSVATVAVCLLFLRGAASSGTPETLSVDVQGVSISKRDLMRAYLVVTKNNYLRRLAEAMAKTIGLYAEKYGLKGELALRIDNKLKSETGQGLSNKEMAWSSPEGRFSQNLPDLKDLASERLVQLLAGDYSKRFSNTKKTNKKEKVEKPKNSKGKNTKAKDNSTKKTEKS